MLIAFFVSEISFPFLFVNRAQFALTVGVALALLTGFRLGSAFRLL